MATTTTAQPSVCVNGGSSSTTAEPKWVTEVLHWRKPSSDPPLMYRAPENMRLVDTDSHIFEPILVSIGPFHHGEFLDMEEHKTRLLSSMLYRHKNKNKKDFLMKLVDAMRTLEEMARLYYSKSFPDIDFVKMMVFDGCFLLEIFRIFRMKDEGDPLWTERWMLPALALDIVKVENQLPYFVLKMLYENTKLPEEPTLKHLVGSFLSVVCSRINLFRSRDLSRDGSKELLSSSQDHTHLLSLFHSTFDPRTGENPLQTPARSTFVRGETTPHIPVQSTFVPSVNYLDTHIVPGENPPHIPVQSTFVPSVNYPDTHIVPGENPPHIHVQSTFVPSVNYPDTHIVPDENPPHIHVQSTFVPSVNYPDTHIVPCENPPHIPVHSTFVSGECPPHSPIIGEGISRSNSFSSWTDHLLSSFCSIFFDNDIPLRDVCFHSFPSATDLRLSGIKVCSIWRKGNPLEIEYSNGVLKIPTLVIDHSTKILMRNMVAYEQCNKGVPDFFTSYVIFMDGLVNSAEDVEVLRTAGVVDHSLKSSEEVSELLNNLTANLEIDMKRGYLADLNDWIYNDHHKPWPQFKVHFKRLVNSREGIVYIITIFALYLTVLQTVFTVLSYFLPR